MKRNKVKLLSSVSLGAALVFGACGETEVADTDVTTDLLEDTVANDNDIVELSFDPELEYKVPTPSDLFVALQNSGSEGNFQFLNDPAKAGDYDDKKSKALNFGVYSADLGYASSFGFGPDIVKYIKAVDDLSSELNIQGAMNGALKERLQAHISAGTLDSIVSISSDTYYKAYDYLDKNDRGATLRMVVAGGWIEGLYLLTSMVDTYDENNPLVQEIANQALTVENIMGFLNDFAEKDLDVQATMEELMDIEMLFMDLEYVEGGEETTSNQDGVVLLSGGERLSITEEQFNDLKAKVADLRNSITG
jgi:hypothetical protein